MIIKIDKNELLDKVLAESVAIIFGTEYNNELFIVGSAKFPCKINILLKIITIISVFIKTDITETIIKNDSSIANTFEWRSSTP